ncbi:hypothetical protein [Aldersonia kunmingensis]|uniref:hypothetical protein n=1 Tax=Aldersonia kunmingensis TaxID=408066 RepID=UPI0008316D42|nr:hypothetical protein [Aldersonia kunmingensis]
MTTFTLLILLMLGIEAGLLVMRHRRRQAPRWIGNYRYNTFRGSDPTDYYSGLDRDSARVDAEMLAMSRRAPHN